MIETLCDDPMALAGCLFETISIEDGNLAVFVADQSCVLECACCHRDAGAGSAQRMRDYLLGKMKSISIRPVMHYLPNYNVSASRYDPIQEWEYFHAGSVRLSNDWREDQPVSNSTVTGADCRLDTGERLIRGLRW